MGTRALVAIRLDDGRHLAMEVGHDGGEVLADRLADSYASRELAALLVSLGDIKSVNADIASCEMWRNPVNPDPRLFADLDALYDSRPTCVDNLHVFEDGKWAHYVDVSLELED